MTRNTKKNVKRKKNKNLKKLRKCFNRRVEKSRAVDGKRLIKYWMLNNLAFIMNAERLEGRVNRVAQVENNKVVQCCQLTSERF